MKSALRVLLIAAIFIAALNARGQTRPLVAFGYLKNDSGKADISYLETIFPVSFASSIKNVFEVDVLRPAEINLQLKKKQSELKTDYSGIELRELTDAIHADLFIYGKYRMEPGNRIRISLNMYNSSTREMFSIINVGRMETQMFRIIDRITVILLNYMHENKVFREELIPSGKKIGIITNVDGAEQNLMYQTFLTKGYHVMSINAVDIKASLDADSIEKFRFIRTIQNSCYRIEETTDFRYLSGAWSSPAYRKSAEKLKNTYLRYYYNYPETHHAVLDKLSKAYSNRIDYLAIIGFNAERSSAWMRCLNMKTGDFIMMQDNFRPAGGTPVVNITEQIINAMQTPASNPYADKKFAQQDR